MKKLLCMALTMLMLFSGFAFSGVSAEASSNPPISVLLDYAPVTFDQEPMIVNDRTMVPFGAIFEAMGATVAWNANTKTVTSILGDTTVVMVIDNTVMTVNDIAKSLDVPAKIYGDRTLVPVRAVTESFGADVKWVPETRTVKIVSKKFQDKLQYVRRFGSVKVLTSNTKEATAAFGMEYFEEYNVLEHTADGTDITVSHTTDSGHVSVSVRTDIFSGTEQVLTKSYVESVANGVVTILNGTLISSDVLNIGGTDFMRIKCTAPGIVHGITDLEPDIYIYIARKNGVAYTMTFSIYGTVSRNILGDFYYMTQSLVIA